MQHSHNTQIWIVFWAYSRMEGADFKEQYLLSDPVSAQGFIQRRISDIFKRQGDIYCVSVEAKDKLLKVQWRRFFDRSDGEY